jgi:hypothetical protein
VREGEAAIVIIVTSIIETATCSCIGLVTPFGSSDSSIVKCTKHANYIWKLGALSSVLVSMYPIASYSTY